MKKIRKRTRQSNRVWAINKEDFLKALDILDHAIVGPPISPKKKKPHDVNLLTRKVVKALVDKPPVRKMKQQKKRCQS